MNHMTKAECKRESRHRKAMLKAAQCTYEDLRKLAGVSERMVFYWMSGARTSARIERAFNKLTAGVPKEQRVA